MSKPKIRYRKTVNECWEITSHDKTANGFHYVMFEGEPMKANEYAYLMRKGFIPDGLTAVQTCGNKSCINPAHLTIGEPPAVYKILPKFIQETIRYYYKLNGGVFGQMAKMWGTHPQHIKDILGCTD